MEQQAINEKDAVIAARVPQRLKKLVQKIILMDCHINESDWLRDAIREKASRDAPQLYREVLQEAKPPE